MKWSNKKPPELKKEKVEYGYGEDPELSYNIRRLLEENKKLSDLTNEELYSSLYQTEITSVFYNEIFTEIKRRIT